MSLEFSFFEVLTHLISMNVIKYVYPLTLSWSHILTSDLPQQKKFCFVLFSGEGFILPDVLEQTVRKHYFTH